MARQHGVHVTAYNVSHEQVEYARERARREGLADRTAFIEDDYRRIAGRFDAFAAVGMLEHVGPLDYPTVAALLDRCLDPRRGRGLLHFIGRDHPQPLNPWIRRWIFPGAYPPTVGEALRGVVEPAHLAVLDVENLRPHYALTLRHWRERFEAALPSISSRFGNRFARAWRLYLAGSEAAFRTASLELFQVVIARPGTPWSRPTPA
jgi:cyclopropane-fatty-acyl-phospholipid synthase